MNNSSFSPPFPIDLNELDHNHLFSSNSSKTISHHEDYAHAGAASSSSNNSISTYPFFISPSPQDFPYYHSNLHHQHHHEVENLYASHGGSILTHPISSDDHQINEKSGNNKLFVCKKEDGENGSVKWMSSKMRLMKKMIIKSSSSTHHDDQTVTNTSSDQNSNSIDQKSSIQSSITSIELVDDNTTKNVLNNMNSPSIRVCSDCNTTKTPLWRSGPRGPKSLCNACGIRQRKARRALAAAAQENGNGQAAVIKTTTTSNKVMKNKDQKTANNNNNNSHLPFKKRCKFTAQSRGGSRKNKLFNNFEDLSTLILSKNSTAFQQVFPQDEKEAAVLLMALSYGLVRG